MGESDLPTTRCAPAEMLEYAVIIHLDRILDYSPLPSSPSHGSIHSGTSGLPDDLYEEEWHAKYRFVWRYGVPDDWVVRRRAPVQERLGGRRDKSPTGGSGAGGSDTMQFPPPSWHDLRRTKARGFQGGCSNQKHG